MDSRATWLRTICHKNGLHPSDGQLALLEHYVSLLLDWNKKINLISRKDEDQVWSNHILHSISLLFKLRLTEKARILDLGTGGGLPGIPLKILLPDSEFLLVDSTRKKIAAVQEMIGVLGLKSIDTAWGRVEELAATKNLQRQFDYIVTRAVAPLKDLLRWSAPLIFGPLSTNTPRSIVLPGVAPPALLAFKGGGLEEEISNARRELVGRSLEIVNLVYPGSEDLPASDKKVVVVAF